MLLSGALFDNATFCRVQFSGDLKGTFVQFPQYGNQCDPNERPEKSQTSGAMLWW